MKGHGGKWFLGVGDMEVSSADPKIWEGGTGPVAGVLRCEYGRIPASAQQVCFLFPKQKGAAVLIPLVKYSNKHSYRTPLCEMIVKPAGY